MDGSEDRSKQPPQTPRTANGNGVVAMTRLRLKPEKEHKSDSYQDLQQLEFSPLLFSSLEHYLPPNMLNVPRDLKLQYMRTILLRYSTEGERTRVRKYEFSLPLCLEMQESQIEWECGSFGILVLYHFQFLGRVCEICSLCCNHNRIC